MSDSSFRPDEVHPFVPCSRNLRRRTGVFLGIEAWELVVILCLSMIPDFLYRIGLIQHVNFFTGLLVSAGALVFVILFKRGKQPNYFSIWLHHRILHPKAWRASQTKERGEPFFTE